ncbi:hypothetical protein CYFUS_004215 [Cystobacter fuscus]|uniref:Transmembrane protein n=1 Tax=Cystobacter fuscus TaxID=43 RepID=A0A250J5F3_9BACT|nr:hypothetical protein [Cystobacter fuscus]ATB38780.1 hypothetical protein CYFUS_004215 [Cystobacter fuscus]
MSDGADQSQPPRRGTPSSTTTPRVSSTGTPRVSSTTTPRVSSTTNPRVMSAARTAPLPKGQEEAISQRLKSESANVALNAVAVLKEMVGDFRQQDRFFKYKAFIVGGWVFLSLATVGLTCARGVKETGDFGAKLIPITSRASVTIMNKSDETWRDVIVVVRDNRGAEWRASVARVDPTKELTVTPKQLLGADGRAAPSDIKIRDVEMRTSEGRARLLENGHNLTEEAP